MTPDEPLARPGPEPEPDPDRFEHEDSDEDEPTAEDLVEEVLDLEVQQRLWLRAILPLIKEARHDGDNHALAIARNLMLIAACDRVTRLLRSDLGGSGA